jgi:tetratricopeptide (TPR) repeat protein
MSAPWWAHALPLDPTTRQIDNYYQVACIAQDVRQIRDYQGAWFERSRDDARKNVLAVAGGTNSLREMAAALVDSSDSTVRQIEGANRRLAGIEEMLGGGFEAIAGGLTELSEQMAELTRHLGQIQEILENPHRTQTKELVGEARRALLTGMNSQGRVREAEFGDALRLIEDVLQDPIGRRDSMAWFHKGWLEWKHLQDAEHAEESFFNAARLAQNEPRALALRHLAQTRYLRGDFAGAVDSIREALEIAPERPELLFDGARFSFASGDRALGIDWLGRSLDLWPFLSIVMMSEPDFLS